MDITRNGGIFEFLYTNLIDMQGIAFLQRVLFGDGIGFHEGHQDNTQAVCNDSPEMIQPRDSRGRKAALPQRERGWGEEKYILMSCAQYDRLELHSTYRDILHNSHLHTTTHKHPRNT